MREMIEPTEINKTEINVFDLSNDEVYFSLSVDDKSEFNEMLLLHYKLEQKENLIIGIYGPTGNMELYGINDNEGFINFLYDKNGTYTIVFKKIEIESLRNLRSTSESSTKVTFEIFTTETPFNIDLKNDNIEFKEFEITNNANEPSLKFNIMPLDKDYIKKISISNYDFSNIHKIVSINENNLGYKELNFTYYTFEKNSNYNVTIKFSSKGLGSYTLENVNILDYSSMDIKNIEEKKISFNDANDKFFIVNWEDIEKVLIKNKKNNPRLLITDITKSHPKEIVKEFKNLKFKELNDIIITKPEKSSYSLLMIEGKTGTELEIELEEDDDGGNNVLIILLSVFGVIVLAIAVFFIIRYIRKNKDDDFRQKAQDIQNETLLKDF